MENKTPDSDEPQAPKRRVAFLTSCWEKEWKQVLLSPDYLKTNMIENHCYPFAEKLVVIVNVENLSIVLRAAEKRIKEGLIDRVVVIQEEALESFGLQRKDFRGNSRFPSDFVYYNAMGPMMGIHATTCDYFVFQRGDVHLKEPSSWIEEAIDLMEKDSSYKWANLVWNYTGTPYYAYREAEEQALTQDGNFYVSDHCFSDQLFLAKRVDFCAPIYKEQREDVRYEQGDTFESRILSAVRNRGWKRLIYAKGAYIHRSLC